MSERWPVVIRNMKRICKMYISVFEIMWSTCQASLCNSTDSRFWMYLLGTYQQQLPKLVVKNLRIFVEWIKMISKAWTSFRYITVFMHVQTVDCIGLRKAAHVCHNADCLVPRLEYNQIMFSQTLGEYSYDSCVWLWDRRLQPKACRAVVPISTVIPRVWNVCLNLISVTDPFSYIPPIWLVFVPWMHFLVDTFCGFVAAWLIWCG